MKLLDQLRSEIRVRHYSIASLAKWHWRLAQMALEGEAVPSREREQQLFVQIDRVSE